MSKVLIIVGVLIALVVIASCVVYAAGESAPAQPTGIELDIDKPKSKPKKPAPAPKARTRK